MKLEEQSPATVLTASVVVVGLLVARFWLLCLFVAAAVGLFWGWGWAAVVMAVSVVATLPMTQRYIRLTVAAMEDIEAEDD